MKAEDYYQAKLARLGNQELRNANRITPPTNPKNIFILGICGTAMGSLAGLLKDAGFNVSGNDSACYPPINGVLKEKDIIYTEGSLDEEEIKKADVIVVGNVCGPEHLGIKFAVKNNIPYISLPEAIDLYLGKNKEMIAICGTHGKTTTTGLVSKIFKTANQKPSYLIGGVPQGEKLSYCFDSGKHFILEGDEYDTAFFDKKPKFLNYHPKSIIITSIELDHMDIYDDYTDYMQAFRFLVESVPDDGLIILNNNYKSTKELKLFTKARILTYGDETSHIYYTNYKSGTKRQAGDVIYKGQNIGRIEIELSGIYNFENCLSALGLALENGISFEDGAKAISEFRGMKRRQEVIFANEDFVVIDDFAHHPTSVKETLVGLCKKYKGKNLVAIFEPRSNTSRRKIFESDYINSLKEAHEVYIKMPALRHNDKPEDFIDVSYMASQLQKGTHVEDAKTLVELLNKNKKSGDVFVFMSNGSFDGAHTDFVEGLEK